MKYFYKKSKRVKKISNTDSGKDLLEKGYIQNSVIVEKLASYMEEEFPKIMNTQKRTASQMKLFQQWA